MSAKEKKKIAVSACLLGIACRYDGDSKPSHAVKEFFETGAYEPVRICPESAGGLPIPRPAHEIVGGHAAATPEEARVEDKLGNDHSEAFVEGARKTCERIRETGCVGAILKAKSPSCGIGCVYDGSFQGTLVEGNGVLARVLLSEGFPCCTEKDIEAGKSF